MLIWHRKRSDLLLIIAEHFKIVLQSALKLWLPYRLRKLCLHSTQYLTRKIRDIFTNKREHDLSAASVPAQTIKTLSN